MKEHFFKFVAILATDCCSHMNMIELRHIQQFVKVAEAGGIREAGRSLHISPSSVTRSIKSLEGHYGVSLFQRIENQMQLTSHGVEVFREFKIILRGLQSIKPKLSQLDAIEFGTLRIGLNPVVADTLLPTLGARFIKEYPNIKLVTEIGNVERLMQLIDNDEVDLIIGLESILLKKKCYEVIRLLETEAHWWVRNEHPLLSKNDVSISDFLNYSILSQYLPEPYEDFLSKALEEEGITDKSIHRSHECVDYRGLYLMAIQSDAIFLAHEFIHKNGYFTDQLRKLNVKQKMPSAIFSVALPIDLLPSPLARKFVEILKEESAKLTEV